jgi:TetR/AcrR family transcriptional regulator
VFNNNVKQNGLIGRINITETKQSTEELILDAALKVFTEKGYAAARMEEIAHEAGINRALLHYYYRSKEKMFTIIFEKQFTKFISGIAKIVSSDVAIFEKIELLVTHELDMFSKNPDIPLFILGELSKNPELMVKRLAENLGSVKVMVKKINEQIKSEYEKGIIKNIPGYSLMLNIMSLCIYPFAARSIVGFITGQSMDEFVKVASGRKQEIIEFVINGIKA